MTYIIEKLQKRHLFGFNIVIDVIDYGEASGWLHEMFEPCENHQGGITVRTPSHLDDGRGYRWWKPLQTSIAELSRCYSAQGRNNPSREAYESLQQELSHYLQASDCAIRVTISKAQITLAEAHSCCFDLSPENPWCDGYWSDYGMETVHDALKEAREKMKALAA